MTYGTPRSTTPCTARTANGPTRRRRQRWRRGILRHVSEPEAPMDGVGDAQWARAVNLIEAADEVCLTCHISPDGDALGSMLAFAQVMHDLRKPCVASFGDPFTVPSNLRFLPGLGLLSEPA